jgi:hypothetical protein
MLRRTFILVGLIAVLAAAGCGSKSSSTSNGSTPAATTTSTVHFAKTKFVFHAGLAFGAFHHFVYLPIKAGDLAHPLQHKLTILKMGLAGLFVYHEVKLAAQDVKASPLLSKLFSPLTALADKIKSLGSSIGSGTASASSADQINSGISSVKSVAAASGQSITESLPSSAQLSAGVAP